jgi:hypothetical protein
MYPKASRSDAERAAERVLEATLGARHTSDLSIV